MLFILVFNSFLFVLFVKHCVRVTFFLLLLTLVVVLVYLITRLCFIGIVLIVSILLIDDVALLFVHLTSPVDSIHVNKLVILIVNAGDVNADPYRHEHKYYSGQYHEPLVVFPLHRPLLKQQDDHANKNSDKETKQNQINHKVYLVKEPVIGDTHDPIAFAEYQEAQREYREHYDSEVVTPAGTAAFVRSG